MGLHVIENETGARAVVADEVLEFHLARGWEVIGDAVSPLDTHTPEELAAESKAADEQYRAEVEAREAALLAASSGEPDDEPEPEPVTPQTSAEDSADPATEEPPSATDDTHPSEENAS